MIVLIHHETPWMLNYAQYLNNHHIRYVDFSWRQLIRSSQIDHRDGSVIWICDGITIDYHQVSGIIHQDLSYLDKVIGCHPSDQSYYLSSWMAYFMYMLSDHDNVFNPVQHNSPSWYGIGHDRMNDYAKTLGFVDWSKRDLLRHPCKKVRVFMVDDHMFAWDDCHQDWCKIGKLLRFQLKALRKKLHCRLITVDVIDCAGQYALSSWCLGLYFEKGNYPRDEIYACLTDACLSGSKPGERLLSPLFIKPEKRPKVQP